MKIRENKKRIEEKKLRSDIIGYEKALKHRKSKYKKIIKLRIPKNKRKRLINSSILFLKKNSYDKFFSIIDYKTRPLEVYFRNCRTIESAVLIPKHSTFFIISLKISKFNCK